MKDHSFLRKQYGPFLSGKATLSFTMEFAREPLEDTATLCLTCGSILAVECPCGTAACRLLTHLEHCPSCHPEAASRELKAHGVRVCDVVVNKEMGSP